MELPFKRVHLRKTLLVLWFPSIAICLMAAGGLIANEGAIPEKLDQIDTVSAADAGLYASAPLRGAVLGDSVVAGSDSRVAMVEGFLKSHRSPMAGSAGTFVSIADKYNLDWRLLVAIAGKESSFGKRIPKNSFNAWGWGIPTGAQSGIAFSSWDAGIETVARGLRRGYFDKGHDTLLKIEKRYTPPSAAQPDHPWVRGVSQFMEDLENYRL